MSKSSKTKGVFSVWKTIYGNWKYLLWVIIITLIFYAINVLIQKGNYKVLAAFYLSSGFLPTLNLFIDLAIGLKQTMFLSSFITLILTGFLLGILLTLIFYKTVALKKHPTSKKQGIFATLGIFLGAAAPGCAACGVGILAIFGVSAAFIGTLPLQGLEISLIAIAILGFSIIYISKGLLECKTCKIQLTQDRETLNK